ncbi:MAG: lysophospholipid acyltransferase family protein [Gammaproteobacteria bacterium]
MIRSLLFTSLFFATVPPWALAAICVRVFGRHASFKVAESWVLMNLWFCKTICGLDLTIAGLENIPDTPGVLYLKHSSAYETLAQFHLVGDQTWVLKRELLWAPFFGWAVRCVHPIAIDRSAGKSAVQQVIDQGTERIDDGIWVSIFPEGTRMAPGTTRRYGVSGVLLAQAAGRPITPVAHNAGYFWPRRGLRKKPGTVSFVVGPPVDPTGREPREVNEEIQDWIESRIAEMAVPDD